jgi:hypothetical protein
MPRPNGARCALQTTIMRPSSNTRIARGGSPQRLRPARRCRTSLSKVLLSSVALASVVGCGDGASKAAASVTINCGASDEGWLAMQDLVNATGATTDDVNAALLSAPANGALLTTSTPTTFQWTLSPPAANVLPHGIDSGAFVWLHFTGAALTAPFDVISVDPGIPDGDAGVSAPCLSYTPSAADWAKLAGAPGTLTVSVYTAKENLNVVTEGPFQSTTNPFTFTVTR